MHATFWILSRLTCMNGFLNFEKICYCLADFFENTTNNMKGNEAKSCGIRPGRKGGSACLGSTLSVHKSY